MAMQSLPWKKVGAHDTIVITTRDLLKFEANVGMFPKVEVALLMQSNLQCKQTVHSSAPLLDSVTWPIQIFVMVFMLAYGYCGLIDFGLIQFISYLYQHHDWCSTMYWLHVTNNKWSRQTSAIRVAADIIANRTFSWHSFNQSLLPSPFWPEQTVEWQQQLVPNGAPATSARTPKVITQDKRSHHNFWQACKPLKMKKDKWIVVRALITT